MRPATQYPALNTRVPSGKPVEPKASVLYTTFCALCGVPQRPVAAPSAGLLWARNEPSKGARRVDDAVHEELARVQRTLLQ